MAEDDGFPVQADVREPWRRFIDDVAPLRPDLLRYCCGLTGNLWDGEDLLQDVLVRVFGQLGKSNADLTRPRSYLIRAETNPWVDRLRRASLERAHREAEEAAPPSDVAVASVAVDVRAAAHALFLGLPPRERAAVLLSDVLDVSPQETASMLKTSVGAVKAALHRGRARLKDGAPARRPAPVPRDVVERFVVALGDRNLDAIWSADRRSTASRPARSRSRTPISCRPSWDSASIPTGEPSTISASRSPSGSGRSTVTKA